MDSPGFSSRNGGPRKAGLQTVFLVGLGVIFFCFSILAAALIYIYQKNSMEEETFYQTELMLAAAAATRQYVQETLRPKMFETFGQDTFLLEAMSSSFVSREVMEKFRKSMPGFIYRRVAINARNPNFEADPFEREVIQRFAANPQAQDWQTIRELDGRKHYIRFRPVRFDSACLGCHDTPEVAPAGIVESFGNERGFNHKEGDVAGLVSVSVPVDVGLERIRETAMAIFSTLFLTMSFLYGIICFFFNRVIVQNLRGVLVCFSDSLTDEKGAELYARVRSQDEIGELNRVAGLIAAHLADTRSRLRDYAENLEQKVTERTRLLEESRSRMRDKVEARGRELKTLNTIAELTTQRHSLEDIIPQVLLQTLQIAPARGAGIYLLDREANALVLIGRENSPGLKDYISLEAGDMMNEDGTYREGNEILSCGQINFFVADSIFSNTLHIPLCCRGRVLGVVAFTDPAPIEGDGELLELLFSVGRQIGITLESLEHLAAVRQSREVLRSVVDGITDMILLIDRECRVRMANRAVVDRCGLHPLDMNGKPAGDLPLSPNPFLLCSAVVRRSPKDTVQELFYGDSGEIFEVNFFPIHNPENGEVVQLVCSVKDVTEQRQVEERIQQTEKLLALGQLAAGVAHEINNPLGVILCHTDILLDDLPRESTAHHDIAIIERHAKNCQRIVADLLHFARVRKSERQRVAINHLVEETMDMLGTHFRHGSFRLTLDLAPNLPELEVDSDRMQQVLVNIAMNAIQAGRGEDNEFRVETRLAENNKVVITLSDNGQGIDENIIGRIFDPFFTTKETGQGTGLGLSISHSIILEHGGAIRAEDSADGWTRFIIELPAPIRKNKEQP